MKKKREKSAYRLITYILTGLVFTILGFLVIRGLYGGRQTVRNNVVSQNLPTYVLSSAEEQRLKEFVQNFVSLYNSYSSQDFSNLKALGDYETSSMQQNTADLIEQLSGVLPAGFVSRGEALPDTFSYSYPDASGIVANIKAEVSQKDESNGKSAKFIEIATLNLVKQGSIWVVETIKINK